MDLCVRLFFFRILKTNTAQTVKQDLCIFFILKLKNIIIFNLPYAEAIRSISYRFQWNRGWVV